MHPQTAIHVRVDVAKDSLAVCSALAAKIVTVPNTAQALVAWLAGLPAALIWSARPPDGITVCYSDCVRSAPCR